MKKQMKKVITLTIVGTLLVTGMLQSSEVKAAKKNFKSNVKQSYIVECKNNKIYDKVMKDYCCESEDNSFLEDNNISALELTSKDVSELKDEGVIVEKDIDVEASAPNNFKNFNGFLNPKYIKRINEKRSRTVEKEKESTTTEYSWNIEMLGVDKVNVGNITENVKIAILDSGIDYCESINVIERKNFIPGEENTLAIFDDNTGHGTAIAGIIASNGVDGTIKGINPDALIYSAKILDENNKAPISRVVEAIYWAIEKEVDIINISFGTTEYSEILHNAVKEAYDAGILIMAAAGNLGNNEGESTVEYPASYDEVVAVGAATAQAEMSEISSAGEEIELMAPGENIKSVGWLDSEVVCAGTSLSVAHVVGVGSLVWQKDMSKSADFVRGLLKASANELQDDNCGEGIVDVEYAFEIYDDYAENYEEKGSMDKISQEYDNPSEIETYNEDVTGSWSSSSSSSIEGHHSIINSTSLNSTYKALLREGSDWSDSETNGLLGMNDNPYFHGFFNDEVANQSTEADKYNYITICELLSEIALHYGNTNKVAQYQYYKACGLKKVSYEAIVDRFSYNNGIKGNSGNYVPWSTLLSGYAVNDTNKKYFIWGMVIHSASDIFAHSSFEKNDNGNWKRIKHVDYIVDGKVSSKYKRADAPDVKRKRYEDAVNVAKYIASYCINGNRTVATDAFLTLNDGQNRSYRLGNLVIYAAKNYGEYSTNLSYYRDALSKVNYLYN